MVLCLGQEGTAAAVYIAVLAVVLFPARVALVLVVADAALLVVLGETVPGWTSGVGVAFAACAAAVAMYGIQQMMLRNLALVSAQAENEELAVENERTRFARDLHDILGHSLTVITVKAELANKLLDVDPERARAEIADLERLSRDALADVRRAVEGYRELSLPGELARARTALDAARIEAVLPNSVDDVPSGRRELFAWAIREGVTNVVRHSGASHCRVELYPDRVEIVDDGGGPQRGCGRPRTDRAARACGRCGRDGRHAGARPRVLALGRAAVSEPIRLLLADDQALVRGALSALLGLERDLEVVAEVSSGDQVLAAAREHRPDVALLDVEMPGLDGIEATAALRKALPDVRVLIVTTFGRPGFLRRAMQAGASGFVVKDTPAAQLADAVRRVHAGLRVVDPDLATESLVRR